MNICFETSSMTRGEAQGLAQLLSSLFPDVQPGLQQTLPFPDPYQTNPNVGPVAVPAFAPTEQARPAPATPATPATPASSANSLPEAQPTKRHRRTKAEIEADEVAARQAVGSQVPASQAPTSQPDPAPAAVAENPAPQVEAQKPLTAEELRTLLNGYISRHSMEDAIEKLKGYGCNRVSEALTLEPAKLAELAAVLRG